MRIALLSDTHGQPLDGVFDALEAQKPELILHAGDLSAHHHDCGGCAGDATDRAVQTEAFLGVWNTAAERFDCPIVVVPGNHDYFLAPDGKEWRGNGAGGPVPDMVQDRLDPRIRILIGSGARLRGGLNIWGSPWTPFCGWAFHFPEPLETPLGARIAGEHWAKIPADTDILITHGPPYGILDGADDNLHFGDLALTAELASGCIAPRLHVFGHIHSGHGRMRRGKTGFVNAAMCDEGNRLMRGAEVVDMDCPCRP